MGKNTRLRLVFSPTLLSRSTASCVLYKRTEHSRGFFIFLTMAEINTNIEMFRRVEKWNVVYIYVFQKFEVGMNGNVNGSDSRFWNPLWKREFKHQEKGWFFSTVEKPGEQARTNSRVFSVSYFFPKDYILFK